MSRPWVRRILQFAGALALVALAAIVYRKRDWFEGVTPDGVMTLMAGIIAFVAVIIQIRSSSRQVRDQIKAQRDAEQVERERQKRAVAAALLSETDCFYAKYLEETSEPFPSWKRIENDPRLTEVFQAPIGKPFVVYESLADKLGGFDAMVARGIVFAYGRMAAFVENLRLYEREMRERPTRFLKQQDDRKRILEDIRNETRQSREQAVQAAAQLCRDLCKLSGTDFSTLSIAEGVRSRFQD